MVLRTAVLIAAVLPVAPLVPAVAQEQGPAKEPPGWDVLEQRPAEGEQCIVCRQRIHDGDIVEVRYKGRTFFVAAKMLEEFEADPDRYFYAMQARGGLFDEATVETPPMTSGWLIFGIYVLVGLVCGAACAYLALDRGLPAWGWFFAGLLANVLAVAAILTREPRPGASLEPAAGMAKIPTTRSPLACSHCGNTNHPSAVECSSCGHRLTPSVEAETART